MGTLFTYICAELTKDVMSLSDPTIHTTVTIYKEEGALRILTGAIDREKTRNKLVTCIDVLNPANHPPVSLINIVTGRISPASVTVDDFAPSSMFDETGVMRLTKYKSTLNFKLSSQIVDQFFLM